MKPDLPAFPEPPVWTVVLVLMVPPVKLALRVSPALPALLDQWVAPVWMVFLDLVVRWVPTVSMELLDLRDLSALLDLPVAPETLVNLVLLVLLVLWDPPAPLAQLYV